MNIFLVILFSNLLITAISVDVWILFRGVKDEPVLLTMTFMIMVFIIWGCYDAIKDILNAKEKQ